MGPVIAVIVVLAIAVTGLVALFYEPGNKALIEDKRLLQEEIHNLRMEIVEKDKELQARRLGLDWYSEE